MQVKCRLSFSHSVNAEHRMLALQTRWSSIAVRSSYHCRQESRLKVSTKVVCGLPREQCPWVGSLCLVYVKFQGSTQFQSWVMLWTQVCRKKIKTLAEAQTPTDQIMQSKPRRESQCRQIAKRHVENKAFPPFVTSWFIDFKSFYEQYPKHLEGETGIDNTYLLVRLLSFHTVDMPSVPAYYWRC